MQTSSSTDKKLSSSKIESEGGMDATKETKRQQSKPPDYDKIHDNAKSPPANIQAQTQSDAAQKFDVNRLGQKKIASNGLMDFSLLMANASQLRFVLTNENHRFYTLLLWLLIFSLLLQFIVGIGLLFLAREKVSEDEEDEHTRKKNKRASILNSAVMIITFVITALNVFISAFGIGRVNIEKKSNSTQPQFEKEVPATHEYYDVY